MYSSKELRAKAKAHIVSLGLKPIAGYAQTIPNKTAKICSLDTKTGKATIEFHEPWDSIGKDLGQRFILSAKKSCAAQELGKKYWSEMTVTEKKAARALFTAYEYKVVQL